MRGEGLTDRTRNIWSGLALVGVIATGAIAANTRATPFEGRVVDPVRTELCDFKDSNPIGEIALSRVDCDLYLKSKLKQTTTSFTMEGNQLVANLYKTGENKQTRQRTIDTSNADIKANTVTKIVLPDLIASTGAEDKSGIWKVSGPNGAPLNISGLKFFTPVPDIDKNKDPNVLECDHKKGDPEYQGCMDSNLETGYFTGIPIIGADNQGNLPRAVWATFSAWANDENCAIESVLMPALTGPGQPPMSPHEATSYLVRAHVRSVAFDEHGVIPQNLDVPIDDTQPFTLGPDLQTTYNGIKGQYGFMPDLKFAPDYCVGKTDFGNDDPKALSSSLSWIRAMGAPQVKNGFNPANGATDDSQFVRAG